MASSLAATAATMAASSHNLPLGEALSGMFGSISLTSWIFNMIPQLLDNYRSQSGEALSMTFLVVWMLGDSINLAGALLTQLTPIVIALPTYFVLMDIAIIGQCLYYSVKNARRRVKRENMGVRTSPEQSPLLARRGSSSAGLAGTFNPTSTRGDTSTDLVASTASLESKTYTSRLWLFNSLALLAVYAIGIASWLISYKLGIWDRKAAQPTPPAIDEKPLNEVIGVLLGYISATFYLCARIPQIVKNHCEQSCEGLALLFFMFSQTGNITYGTSLLVYSQDRHYLLKALPWLLGSGGTIIEDGIIFVQFRLYARNKGPRIRSA